MRFDRGRNTNDFARMPASGGRPESESIMVASAKAWRGRVRARPARSAMFSTAWPLRRIAWMAAKTPRLVKT